MKKKTFYVILAVWCVALATLVGVLLNHFLNKDDDSTIKPPANQEQSGGGNGDGNGAGDVPGDDDDKNWTGNY